MADTQTPQSPAPLAYKGVFFTHSFKGRSMYNYMYDKLAHIKFLGIGTHEGEILPEILTAVLVKIIAEHYKEDVVYVTRSKDNKALIESRKESGIKKAEGFSPRGDIGAVLFREGEIDEGSSVEANKLSYEIAKEIAKDIIAKHIKSKKEIKDDAAFIGNKISKGLNVSVDYLSKVVLRDADIAGISSILIEKAAREGIFSVLKDALKEKDGLELIHYYLYGIDKKYFEIVNELLTNFSRALGGVSIGSTVNVYKTMVKKMLDHQHIIDKLVSISDRIKKAGLTKEDIADVKKSAVLNIAKEMKKVIEENKTAFDYVIDDAFKSLDKKFASIEVDIPVVSDEGKKYKAILDKMYNSFVKMYEEMEIEEREIHNLFTKFKENGGAMITDVLLRKDSTHEARVDDYQPKLELSDKENEDGLNVVIKDDYVLGELFDKEDQENTYVLIRDQLLGELLDKEEENVAPVIEDPQIFGELVDKEDVLSGPIDDPIVLGELSEKENEQLNVLRDMEITADLSESEDKSLNYLEDQNIIAVLSGSEPEWSFRRRPPLEKEKEPEPPEFEHVCSGFVCVDWLQIPLVDFGGDYTKELPWDENLNPRYPTGKYDEEGNPYILPPYSILNEPISNGVDVGGKQMMAINPCNLYDVINYLIKVYDYLKPKLAASDPISAMSRVMNMLFDEIQKLVEQWDITKQYTPDEMWRIYRFVRWIAIGVTNKYYRLKIVYRYEDFIEQFEVTPYSDWIKTNGAVVRNVPGAGNVLDGHPTSKNQTNSAEIEFTVPKKTRSATISFDIGNYVPERPPKEISGTLFRESFEGDPDEFKIKGDGWVVVDTPYGKGIAIEDPAKKKLYKTNTFTINPMDSGVMTVRYKVDTNMDTTLTLRQNGSVVWTAPKTVNGWSFANISLNGGGNFNFEVNVPQAESGLTSPILFTASQIDKEWLKTGYLTQWEVKGDMIFEKENTPMAALIVNPRWLNDTEYIVECEVMTTGGPSGAEDFIGLVFNFKDANNYYAAGMWARTTPDRIGSRSGVWRVSGGRGYINESTPTTWNFKREIPYEFNVPYKMRIEVNGNSFRIFINGEEVLSATDPTGWGGGASGLIAYSNPNSTFRNFKYYAKPRFDVVIDEVIVNGTYTEPVAKPKYAIDFYLDGDDKPAIKEYSNEAKTRFTFPIMDGEHKVKWVFKKLDDVPSISEDASYIDNIVITGVKKVEAWLEEEFIGCGGHFAVKSLIDNLLEYYRRHHEACKGRRDIWIIE